MNDMCGIDYNVVTSFVLGRPFRALGGWCAVPRSPRAMPWAAIGRAFGAGGRDLAGGAGEVERDFNAGGRSGFDVDDGHGFVSGSSAPKGQAIVAQGSALGAMWNTTYLFESPVRAA